MGKKITLKDRKKAILDNKFKKDFQRAVNRGSYIYLEDKTIQKKAMKVFGYTKEQLNLITNSARDKNYYKNEKRKEQIKEKRKLQERKSIVKNINKLTLDKDDKQKIISDTSLGLLKFVGKKNAELNIRKELVNKVNDLFFGEGQGKGILKGAFQRNLDKATIDNFVKEIEKFIMTSKNAVMRVSKFYENIDKYFEYIYEENNVEKGFYKTGNHSVEMGYILEDLLVTFKSGEKQ